MTDYNKLALKNLINNFIFVAINLGLSNEEIESEVKSAIIESYTKKEEK